MGRLGGLTNRWTGGFRWTAPPVAVIGPVAVVGSVVLAGCGTPLPFVGGDDQRYLEAGEDLIEGDLATEIGLGVLTAECSGRGLDPGETFTCSGSVAGRPPIAFVATVSPDGESVDLVSTNLLLAGQVEEIETFAASLIATDTGLPVGNEQFECADNSIVVGPDRSIDCLVTDPTDQTIHAVKVMIDDFETLSITVDVGEPVG